MQITLLFRINPYLVEQAEKILRVAFSLSEEVAADIAATALRTATFHLRICGDRGLTVVLDYLISKAKLSHSAWAPYDGRGARRFSGKTNNVRL